MRRLFYRPDTAAMAPHAALAEAGLPYELVLVERAAAQAPDSAFRRLNPLGTVPVLQEADGIVIRESMAIALFIADQSPSSELLPSSHGTDRAGALQWLAYLATTVQPAFMRSAYPERFTTEEAGRPAVRESADATLAGQLDHVDRHLEGRSWLAGDRRTVADLHLFMLGFWGRRLRPPSWERAALLAHAQRAISLPGVRRMLVEQGLEVPEL